VPRVLPRVIKLPENCCPKGEQHFVLLSSVIRAHLAELFPGRVVESFSQFRVTRDSDLEVDEDDIRNLRQALRRGLTTRHYGRRSGSRSSTPAPRRCGACCWRSSTCPRRRCTASTAR
jgi:polyphosphate kinase